ncbi:hypothetical protein C2G38_1882309, partial [Gigaspora rosea]
KMKSFVNIRPIWTDMCSNSCCVYTENYKKLTKCPICKSDRYYYNKARKLCQQFAYFLLAQHLIIQYGDSDCATKLRYRANYVLQRLYKNNTQIEDVFDGIQYKELVQNGHFQDERDVVLLALIDSYQIFRQKTNDCW